LLDIFECYYEYLANDEHDEHDEASVGEADDEVHFDDLDDEASVGEADDENDKILKITKIKIY